MVLAVEVDRSHVEGTVVDDFVLALPRNYLLLSLDDVTSYVEKYYFHFVCP
jgi:hypothetical protein